MEEGKKERKLRKTQVLAVMMAEAAMTTGQGKEADHVPLTKKLSKGSVMLR